MGCFQAPPWMDSLGGTPGGIPRERMDGWIGEWATTDADDANGDCLRGLLLQGMNASVHLLVNSAGVELILGWATLVQHVPNELAHSSIRRSTHMS